MAQNLLTRLVPIPISVVDSVWEEVKPLLEVPIIEVDELSLDDVYRWIMERDMQLWLNVRILDDSIVAVATTIVVQYSNRSAVRIVHLSGEGLPLLKDYLKDFSDWALAQGATKIEAWCRPGITKVMKADGFHKKYELIELDLRRSMQ